MNLIKPTSNHVKWFVGLSIIVLFIMSIVTVVNTQPRYQLRYDMASTPENVIREWTIDSPNSHPIEIENSKKKNPQHYTINKDIQRREYISQAINSREIYNTAVPTVVIVPTATPPLVQIDVDREFVTITRGEVAVNSGRIHQYDPTLMQIQSSIGVLELMPDKSWLWLYSTDNSSEDQSVIINIIKAGQIIATQSFTLILADDSPVSVDIDRSLIVDQSSITVEYGNIAVNTGTIEGVSPEIKSSNVSFGNMEILSDGSWIWIYSTVDEIVDSPMVISVNVETIGGAVLQSTFVLNIIPKADDTVTLDNDEDGTQNQQVANPSLPTNQPTVVATMLPTQIPATITPVPTTIPTELPTQIPATMTQVPTTIPTELPTQIPATMTQVPTLVSTELPTQIPATMTQVPTTIPTELPTQIPATMTSVPTTIPSIPIADAYYVSRLGNNGNGRSWSTAWNELDQIDWSIIEPGDTIYLDGGSRQMQYDTNLEFGKSGQPNNPIHILASSEANHNGQVIFFGGRDKPLPYCDQPTYDNSDASQLIQYGIQSDDYSYIVIDGMDWSGITIHGYGRSGIRIDRYSKNITFRNLEVYNNGSAKYRRGSWGPSSAGVKLAGENMTFQRVIIHDNGHDAFQSLFGENNLSNFRLEQSWLYNGRKHPTVDESANYCTHTDGIQIYSGGVVSGINITESILGPGFTHNLILGQTKTSSGEWAVVNDLFLQDVILSKAADNNLHGYSGTSMHNWTLNRVTIHCPKTKGHCARAYNSDHTITNSVFYGSRLTFPDGVDNRANNCIWQTSGYDLGLEVNPNFLNVSDVDHFSLDDYTVQNPNCVGSQLTSVAQLFSGVSNNLLAQPIVSARVVQSATPQVVVQPTIEPTVMPTDIPLNITVDNIQIDSLEGQSVVNAGQIMPSTTTIETITASLGTVSLIDGVGWTWDYMPDDGPSYDQIVTVDIRSVDGTTTQTSFVVNVDNVSPTAKLSATLIDTQTLAIELAFTDTIDPSVSDMQAGFTFQYDCNGDGIFEITNEPSTVCNFVSLEGINSVARIMDKDNGFTDYYIDTDQILAEILVPTDVPTLVPTLIPTDVPTLIPTNTPTLIPTDVPTLIPTNTPTLIPTDVPTLIPTNTPTLIPTDVPTLIPTDVPTLIPTDVPTLVPTDVPTLVPTDVPTLVPTNTPTLIPTDVPSLVPTNTPET